MYRAAKELRHLMNRIASEGRMHPSDVTEIMRLARKLLETSRARSSHRTLALYCDWLAHSTLDRPHNLEILIDLGQFIQNFRDDMEELYKGLASAIGIPALRDDMLRLFWRHQVDARICVGDHNWSMFVGVLLRKLVEYPIEFPFDQWWGVEEKRYKDKKKAIKSLTFLMPLRLQIMDLGDKFPVLEISCDGHGWLTDKEHYIELRVPLMGPLST